MAGWSTKSKSKKKVQCGEIIEDPSAEIIARYSKNTLKTQENDSTDSKTAVQNVEFEKKPKIHKLLEEIEEYSMQLKNTKIPHKIRMGMLKKHEERMKRVQEQDPTTRMSLKQLSRQAIDGRSPLSTSRQVAQKFIEKRLEKDYRQRGLKASFGKYKNGVLYLSKEEIK
ncbi:hypothetical protein ROZALSC1DRAFT_27198 [Rozella allomycis CSF55]|uniref:Uncharacterized protein n=1 Tax=Rozella allomycis (strain CSF55) TaxID=988480 RepID=A0A075ARN3_ROZAC|nr:hypothetical protein O9G_001083 [Rozella allomycis CSF55]RKP21398.1 hypothetical protein ROZALSC1DRAFT_27198 [Rozella allomycis CSF55]|eukprot:EPZ31172.1 hypothetical protein O9G_001083 [Rozella allomycis CSF55]